MIKTIVKVAFASTVLLLAIVATVMTVFAVGPTLETRYFPVFKDVVGTYVASEHEGQILHMTAAGTKVRQCEWKTIVAMVERDGKWYQADVFFANPRHDTNPKPAIAELPPQRPLGYQDLGHIYVYPIGTRIRTYVYHQCHPLWTTVTLLYDIKIN